MANPWFRLYAEFASDHKIQMMSEAFQRRFVMLLCLRCSNGDVTLQDEEVAFQLRISNDDWLETKASFVAKNLIDKSNRVIAWERRQFVSDSSADRVARHRERKKHECNVTVTPPDTEQNRTDTDQNRVEGKPTPRKRGARLPADWELPTLWMLWAQKERPDLNVEAVSIEFKDYWLSTGSTKADWEATWRNWVRRQRANQSLPRGRAPNANAALFASMTHLHQHQRNEEEHHGRTIDVTPRLG